MIRYFKKGIYTLLFCLLAAGRLIAQDPQYFVYIQHEKQQPFYVKYKGKILSSSDRGYIILSELPAGTLPVAIGFAKSDEPEQQFKIKVGKDDQGFLLKRTDDKTYALYNLQTFAVTMAGSDGGENGRLQPLDQTAAATAETTSQPEMAPETAEATPAPPAADTNGQAMMAALKKDLDAAMAGKAEVSATTAATTPAAAKPARKTNKFAETLDKVVHDDRPDDISLEEPKAPAPVAAAAVPVAVDASAVTIDPGEGRRNRRKRNKEREPLTAEEQALAREVLAEEQKAALLDDDATAAGNESAAKAKEEAPKEQPATPPADQPATDAAVAAAVPAILPATEDVTEKKPRKSKKKKDTDPQFIEFMDDSTQERQRVAVEETTPAPAVEDAAMAAATDTTAGESRREKRKKRKLAEAIEITENPNNIVKDSVDYDAPRRRDKQETSGSALKMVNSDCEKQLDEDGFRKLLRKFVAAKDDAGMIEAFRRNTRGYCLETAQIKRLAQLVNTDEYRYQLLDMAYPKAYDSDKYGSLSDLLADSYYQGRFKAMLHK
ncbi:DUF4476 domain-containing protein [uncultured Chitinophaga sp.]|jgi:hypothetical protein|uniref:DUF4476 domain-containing protein n=1 Tax=uncultured Chitinophaga sp. TaxID=339340 RepID=UPI002637FEBA|nr:DUF4476 domain-containing protein [uncultured Chitinophaga sp.]